MTPRTWTLAIDFGTTSTVAAVLAEGERPQILEVDGQRRLPSVVLVDDDGSIVVGTAAAGLASTRPDRAIRAPKSRLGEQVPIVLGGQPHQATALVAEVLRHVLAEAVRHQGSPPSRSRLTYPATWNRPQRARLLEAATKAGLPTPELVAEPVAAALTYAEQASVPTGGHVAVYDLGGGTFDTAVLQSTSGGFRVVGRPLGDNQIGGELFDEMLMNFVGDRIDPAAWEQLLISEEKPWRRAAARLRDECTRVKETLSTHPYGEIGVGLPDGTIDVRVERSDLEGLVSPYVDESIRLVERCVADAGQTADSLAAIYVTGGGSRMPLVEEKLRAAFPDIPVHRQGDPKTAVALGALIATPASLDASLAASADHPTLATSAPPPPPPPPPSPATSPLDHPSPANVSWYRNRLILGGAVVAAILAVVGVVFALTNGTDPLEATTNTSAPAGPTSTQPSQTTVPSSTTPGSTAPATTAATSSTTTSTTSVFSSAAPSLDGGPSQEQIETVVISLDDMGPDWVAATAGEDEPLCETDPVPEPVRSVVRLYDPVGGLNVTQANIGSDSINVSEHASQVDVYETAEDAARVIAIDQELETYCGTDTVVNLEGFSWGVEFVAPEADFPAAGDGMAAAGFVLSSSLDPSVTIAILSVEVQWGRSIVGASAYVFGRQPNEDDVKLVTTNIVDSFVRLQELPK